MNNKLVIRKRDNLNTRLAKKRYNNSQKRKLKSKYKLPYFYTPDSSLESTYKCSKVTYENEIENFCHKNLIHKWSPSNNVITFEDTFSLYDDPNKVIRVLLEMLHTAKTDNVSTTRLEYKGHVSFGALYLIDNLCWEIGKKRVWRINCQDINSNEKEKLSKLRSFQTSSYDDVNASMLNTRVYINRSEDPKASQSYLQRSKEITDLIQNALRDKLNDPNYELDHDTYMAINSTIGEHFDNIVLHAKEAETGMLCAFYDKFNMEITLLIYNFGKTIYESLNKSSIPHQIQGQIDEIIANHTKKNFFGVKSSFTKENALTLLAIQEGISSMLEYDKTRGHGLMDFIEHCFNLTQETKIVIISGKTAINIDKNYKAGKQFIFGRERRILALNSENDLFNKPDSGHVKNMSVFFPGVLIETTIPLN